MNNTKEHDVSLPQNAALPDRPDGVVSQSSRNIPKKNLSSTDMKVKESDSDRCGISIYGISTTRSYATENTLSETLCDDSETLCYNSDIPDDDDSIYFYYDDEYSCKEDMACNDNEADDDDDDDDDSEDDRGAHQTVLRLATMFWYSTMGPSRMKNKLAPVHYYPNYRDDSYEDKDDSESSVSVSSNEYESESDDDDSTDHAEQRQRQEPHYRLIRKRPSLCQNSFLESDMIKKRQIRLDAIRDSDSLLGTGQLCTTGEAPSYPIYIYDMDNNTNRIL